jgi:pyridoxal biosynthesis lyase PdxS
MTNTLRKDQFTVPFVCGCRNLGEAARRIGEGAAMLRTNAASPKLRQPHTNGTVN